MRQRIARMIPARYLSVGLLCTTAALAGCCSSWGMTGQRTGTTGSRRHRDSSRLWENSVSTVNFTVRTSGTAAQGRRDARPAFGAADEAGGALVFLDSIRFDPGDGPLDSPNRPGRFDCLATLLLIGPLVRDLAGQLLADIASRPVERRAALVCSASPHDFIDSFITMSGGAGSASQPVFMVDRAVSLSG